MGLVNFLKRRGPSNTRMLIDHGFPGGVVSFYNLSEDQESNLIERWLGLFVSPETINVIETHIKNEEYDALRTLLGEGFEWVKFVDEQLY